MFFLKFNRHFFFCFKGRVCVLGALKKLIFGLNCPFSFLAYRLSKDNYKSYGFGLNKNNKGNKLPEFLYRELIYRVFGRRFALFIDVL